LKELGKLKKWLLSTKTRFRQQAKVAMAVEELLHATGDERWMSVKIEPLEKAKGQQATRGRPHKNAKYVKRIGEVSVTKYEQLRQARTP